MEQANPIIAIVGSARLKIIGDEVKEAAARSACRELGKELANAGFRIAVYTSKKDFIEQDVVNGYLETGKAAKRSIICYYPYDAELHFPQMDSPTEKDFFDEQPDPSQNWEVSFYRSLTKVDGVLLLGGGASTFTSGQIIFSRSIPFITIAAFGGAALELWKNIKMENIPFIEENDIKIMGNKWNTDSAKSCVGSLGSQLNKTKKRISDLEETNKVIKAKAQKWEEHLNSQRDDKERSIWAFCFLLLFIIFLIIGLVILKPNSSYSFLTIIGLCVAGGFGSTIRMITPGAPKSKKWKAPILGITVGLVFSLLYLIPQLIQGSGFLLSDPNASVDNKASIPAIKVQYITALLVSFMAGLSFDFAIEQLLKKSKENQDEILRNKL